MKHTEYLVLGLAGLALFMIVRASGGTRSTAPASPRTNEIKDYDGSGFDNGWRYFTDGVKGYAIDPAGAYWMGGQRIWSPA